MTIQAGVTVAFVLVGAAASDGPFTWSVLEAGGGSVTDTGVYTAPPSPGVFHVVATGGRQQSSATVTVGAASPSTTTASPTTSGVTVSTVGTGSAVTVRVNATDQDGPSDLSTPFVRAVGQGERVWLSAPLRSGTAVFQKWLRGGVDYDRASTTTLVVSGSEALTAIYATPTCAGIAVNPGIDSVKLAVDAHPGAATFCIKAGVHRFTKSVGVNANQAFIGEPGAILNGSKIVTGWTRSGSAWVVTGQRQREPTFDPTHCAAGHPECVYPEKTFLDGVELSQVTSLGALASGKWFFDYASGAIYLYDDPTGHTVETTTGAGGLIGFESDGDTGVTVRNLVFEKFGGGDVSGSAHLALKAADGWLVENNEFRFNANAALTSGNSIVRNNHVHDNGKYGLTGKGTFEGNVVEHNNVDGFDPQKDAGGSKFLHTNGLVLRGNRALRNVGTGLWTDTDNVNVTYENNVVEDNSENGIFHEVSCAAVIRNNVARGNNTSMKGKSLWWGAQIFTRSSKDVEIAGNLVDASTGVHSIGIRHDTGYSTPQCGTMTTGNISVHDNVFRIGTGSLHGDVGTSAGWGVANGIRFFANRYRLADLSGSYFLHDGAATPMTVSGWRAAGQDVDGHFGAY